MDKTDGPRRWGVEQRLEFIEFRSFWEGDINRRDIIEQFGVSVPQASGDLTLYQKLAPTNLRYDASAKRYVPQPDFAPRFFKPNPDRYLLQLKAISEQVIKPTETWIAGSLDVDAMPVPSRRIEPVILKRLIGAIRAGKSIEIHYQSMNKERPIAIWRRITPHAFAYDGLRWHVRAFCHIANKFKDFILSRCRELQGEGPPGAAPSSDLQWTSFFNVILKPNPDLTESQRHTIALDYDMADGQVTIAVRAALLYYFEKRLRLDIAPAKDRPQETPVVVANWDSFVDARNTAMA